MRYVIAIIFPWLSLLFEGKIGAGIVCLILQLTLIGWLPATVWAITSLNRMYSDRRTNAIITAMKHNHPTQTHIHYQNPTPELSVEEKARLYDESQKKRR